MAPVWSEILPVSDPVSVWARAGTANAINRRLVLIKFCILPGYPLIVSIG
jgi:hypothetical protein